MVTLLSNSLSVMLASEATAGEANPDIFTHPNWLLGLMTAGLGLVAVWLFRRINQPKLPKSIVPALVEKVAVISLSILVAHFSFTLGCRRGLGLTGRRWKTDTIRGLMTGLAALPICMFVLALVVAIAERCGTAPAKTHSMLLLFADGNTAAYWRWLIVLTTVILAPLAEEIFFRGLVQSMVRRYTNKPWFGIVATSLLFAICHYPYWQTFPSLIILAVFLGYNYERTGRLLPAIVAHAIFNAIQLLAVLH